MSNSTNKFSWNQDNVNKLVHDASTDIRVVRPLLKLHGKQGNYTQNIFGHRVVLQEDGLTIPDNQNLTPVILSCDITLQQERFSDEDALNTLAVEAAYRVAAAEDAVILLGGENAQDFIQDLGVTAEVEQLKAQKGLLSEKEVSKVEQPILDSIVQGIAELQNKNRLGRYAAVVSLDLFQQAMKPRQNPFDAPIYEIRPLLIENGFRQSQALPKKTGVIFSLNGDGLKIAVPVDTSVEFVEEKKDVYLQVVEQIRLVVDVPEAVEALK
jgi:uncharacterized linocin/CFP29 family protein